MKTLFVLENQVWDANDHFENRCCDPQSTDLYLFASSEEAEKYASHLETGIDIYNEGTIFRMNVREQDIVEVTGVSMEDFEEMLATPYSEDWHHKNYGEDEKSELASFIIEHSEDCYTIDCNNYDFNASLEGSILVVWSWEQHVGYARKCIEIRQAWSSDTNEILAKQDRTFVPQVDVLLTAEEVASAGDNLKEVMREKLADASWKWSNENDVRYFVENF